MAGDTVRAMTSFDLPWRGPGDDRPDLPLRPGPMPLRRDGQLRKRWRYVGVFAPELMLCAARAEVGPLGQSFWVMWDREGRRHDARTSLRPGSREVTHGRSDARDRLAGPAREPAARRGAADRNDLPERLRLGLDPEASRRAGRGHGRGRRGAAGRSSARGIDDESAGYHQRHTSWRWSAGVGRAGTAAASPGTWSRESTIRPTRSERAIWVDGEPSEPAPVLFRGMDGDRPAPAGTPRLRRRVGHARDENFLLVRSRYRHRFGSFSGSLGGLRLAEGSA